MSKTKKDILWYSALILLLLMAIITSMSFGSYEDLTLSKSMKIMAYDMGLSSKADFLPLDYNVFFNIRFPRIVMGIIVGGALAMSGAVMQGLFRNPLADPSLIGVSTGASTTVSLGIIFGASTWFPYEFLNYYSLNFMAFVGALTVMMIALVIAGGKNTISLDTLLLTGIALNAIAASITGLMIFMSEEQQLRDINFWMLGSLGGASWEMVLGMIPFAIFPCFLLAFKGSVLNLISLGEENAYYSGINVDRQKIILVLLTTLAVGACVSVSGSIGFVGLVVPHLIRLIKGNNYKLLLISSALLGAILILISDTLSRTIIAPAELPIGIITSLCGGPFFIWLIARQKKSKSIRS